MSAGRRRRKRRRRRGWSDLDRGKKKPTRMLKFHFKLETKIKLNIKLL